jgi:hypothetical protein
MAAAVVAGGVVSAIGGELGGEPEPELELEPEPEPVPVGETAAGQAGSTQAAAAGRVAAAHLAGGAHRCRVVAALAGMDRERASPVGSSSLRQERSASKKELGANLSTSIGWQMGALKQAARGPMNALSLGASGGWGWVWGLRLVDWVRAARAIDDHVQNHCMWRRRGHVPGSQQPCPAAQTRSPASGLQGWSGSGGHAAILRWQARCPGDQQRAAARACPPSANSPCLTCDSILAARRIAASLYIVCNRLLLLRVCRPPLNLEPTRSLHMMRDIDTTK